MSYERLSGIRNKEDRIIRGVAKNLFTVSLISLMTVLVGTILDGLIISNFLGETAFAAFGLSAPLTNLIELVGNLIGDKSNNVLFNNSKIKQAVPEFMTRTRFDQGARECVEYMYSHPECQQLNPEFDAWYDSLLEAWDRAVESFPKYEGPMY